MTMIWKNSGTTGRKDERIGHCPSKLATLKNPSGMTEKMIHLDFGLKRTGVLFLAWNHDDFMSLCNTPLPLTRNL